jgi:hypothetical protein
MNNKTLCVSTNGLRRLLTDIYNTRNTNSGTGKVSVRQPVLVYPAPTAEKIFVELDEWTYTRLLEADLASRYSGDGK